MKTVLTNSPLPAILIKWLSQRGHIVADVLELVDWLA